jgi:hypothetical protein
MVNTITVETNYDVVNKVWFVTSCDLFGVHAEASTFDLLCEKLPSVVRDVIAADGQTGETEIVVHASIRLAVAAAAE